ncbi:MAG: hypothetical protein E7263_09110 [Lachnospiraceae bacterium]|nr:hypothetical protein [Lachnospiraceae bacterium]
MKSMTMENMMEANGGKMHCYVYYKCNICGTKLGSKFSIKSHCKRKHGISTCWRTMYYCYQL